MEEYVRYLKETWTKSNPQRKLLKIYEKKRKK